MAEATAAGTSPTKQFVDVLPLTFARQLNQAQLRELRDLGPCGVIADRAGEMLQQLELIPAGIHIDEIDDDHPTDVAKLQLPRDFDRRLTVGPENGFSGVG